MPDTLPFLAVIVIAALAFDFINGFHDSANAIATSVSTRALSPRDAILMAAVLNFAGAFVNTEVAKTIGKGIIAPEAVTMTVVLAALSGAIIWNIITWRFGVPSSSSHALIGGIIGAGVAASGVGILNLSGIIEKILIPGVLSVILGLGAGFIFMALLINIFQRAHPRTINARFRRLQLLSAGFMAFSHGSNDAQKSMGIITMALFSSGHIKEFHIPLWVIVACAVAMGLGTSAGGWRIIRTMGTRIIKLDPAHGFAAETSAAVVIQTATHFGAPISTTHTISSAIMGVGATKRLSAVRWGIAGNIIWALVLTIPVCALLAGGSFLVLRLFIS